MTNKTNMQRELPALGTISGVRGSKELWLYLNSLLQPLGFKKGRSTVSFCHFSGEFNQHPLQIEFFVRKKTHYFGYSDHLGRVRTFQGLDMRISLPVKTQTRLDIGTRVGGTGIIRKTLLWLVKLKHRHLYPSQHKLFNTMDILINDPLWTKAFLDDKKVITILAQLTNSDMKLISWSIKFIPHKMTINRRLSSLSMLTDSLLKQNLQQIIQLAEYADQKPAGIDTGYSKLEQLQKDDPKKAMWYSAARLLLLFLLGFVVIIGIPFVCFLALVRLNNILLP